MTSKGSSGQQSDHEINAPEGLEQLKRDASCIEETSGCAYPELLASAEAIIELTDALLQSPNVYEHLQLDADLRRIRASAAKEHSLLSGLLNGHPDGINVVIHDRTVRHDLRTPLNHILGYCELWLDEIDCTLVHIAPDLQKLRQLGRQLLDQLEELISASQEDRPQFQIKIAPQLPATLQKVVDHVSDRLAENRVKATPEASRVLVVDDNEINCDILSQWLLRSGHTVTVAMDGRAALEQLRVHPMDLVLLDILMPEMDGLQVLEAMKRDSQLKHIPVIMVSALDEMDSVVRSIEMGAEEFLPKPFNPVLLKARINACLEKKRLRDREVLYHHRLKREKKRADQLLHVILPSQIVEELKYTNCVKPRRYERVAVLFCDIVGFTPFCEQNDPEEVVSHLQLVIEAWEELAHRFNVEKIKTIGDAFMAACGLLKDPGDHPVIQAACCGVEMIAAAQRLVPFWNVRVGIHFGSVVAGIIGHRQFLFDLWGDTVNTAARMESHGIPGSVVMSGTAWEEIASRCNGTTLGVVPVKGKKDLEMVRFDGLRENPLI